MNDPIRIVDAHIHLWDLSTGLYPHFKEPSDSFIGLKKRCMLKPSRQTG